LILLIIIASLSFKDFIPFEWKVLAFTLSAILKKLFMFVLPLLIFPFIINSFFEIRAKGAYLAFCILLLTFISNTFSIMIAYFFGTQLIPFFGIEKIIQFDLKESISPIFDINLTPFLGVSEVMIIAAFMGMVLGCMNNYKKPLFKIILGYQKFSQTFFEKVFIPILPLYVLGSILKVTHETDFSALLQIFGNMIAVIVIVQFSYIIFLFFLGSGKGFNKTIACIKNALPSAIIGFSTMSSLVTMPVTLRNVEKNTDNARIAKLTVNMTVNCHDVGDCIAIPMMMLTIIYATTMSLPALSTYFWFALSVSFAQFSGVSIPGGSIIIICPFLVKFFGFSNEMLSLIIVLSILMDPLCTAKNVMGNNAFAMIINRFFGRIFEESKIKMVYN
jgi:Na+/H+-dicarboxylate symporter